MIKLDSRDKRREYLDTIVRPDKENPTIVTAERRFSNRTVTTIDFASDFLYRHIKLFCELKDPNTTFHLFSTASFIYFINDQAIFQEMSKLCYGASNFNFVPSYFQVRNDKFNLGSKVSVVYSRNYLSLMGLACIGGVVLVDKQFFNSAKVRVLSRFSGSPESGRLGLLHII